MIIVKQLMEVLSKLDPYTTVLVDGKVADTVKVREDGVNIYQNNDRSHLDDWQYNYEAEEND